MLKKSKVNMAKSSSGNSKRAFYDLSEFPDFKWLASQYRTILEELEKNTFWMNWGSDNYDPLGHCKFLSGDWTVCPIYFGNYDPHSLQIPDAKPENAEEFLQQLPEKFPETRKLLQKISTVNYAAFSRLHPKSVLAPHKHNNPLSLIFHLGLVIPSGGTCGLSVDNKVHIWNQPGDAVIFNDMHEHSAWNHSDQERIVLYVDFQEITHFFRWKR